MNDNNEATTQLYQFILFLEDQCQIWLQVNSPVKPKRPLRLNISKKEKLLLVYDARILQDGQRINCF